MSAPKKLKYASLWDPIVNRACTAIELLAAEEQLGAVLLEDWLFAKGTCNTRCG